MKRFGEGARSPSDDSCIKTEKKAAQRCHSRAFEQLRVELHKEVLNVSTLLQRRHFLVNGDIVPRPGLTRSFRKHEIPFMSR